MIAKRKIAALLAYLEIVLSDSCEIGFACAGTIGYTLAIMGKIPAVAIAGCLIVTSGEWQVRRQVSLWIHLHEPHCIGR